VIAAIARGDWHAAGHGVLNLPSHGTTFALHYPTRARAINAGRTRPPEDPRR